MATVNTTDPKPGYVYNQDDDTWYPLLGIATSQSLEGLSDVSITSPTTSQILVYDGTNWVNGGETGDISAVTSGTGITVTNGTGPIPTIAIDTAVVATTSNTITMENKTLTTPTITQGTSTPSFSANAYTLVAGDAGKALLASNSTTAGTVNVPTNGSVAFAIGTQITIIQTGSGQLTISATTPATTTILSTGATAASPKCRAQYSAITLLKTATDTWYAFGDIS